MSQAPEDLRAEFDFSLGETGCTLDELLTSMKSTLDLSVRTTHPCFISKLYQGSDPVGQAAELLTSVLNTN